MEDTKQGPNIGRGVLQAIFAVFLGLMITAVVGVGVYTFHPNPGEAYQEQIQALYDERSAIDGCNTPTPEQCRAWDQLTPAEQARTKAIDAEVTTLQRAVRGAGQPVADEHQRGPHRHRDHPHGGRAGPRRLGRGAEQRDPARWAVHHALRGRLGAGVGQLGHPVRRAGRGARGVPGPGVPEVRARARAGGCRGGLGGVLGGVSVPVAGGASAEVAELSSRVEALERRLAAAAQGLSGEDGPATGRGAS